MVVLICWFLEGIVFSFLFGLYIYVLGCELTIRDTIHFDFDIFISKKSILSNQIQIEHSIRITTNRTI